MAFGSQTGTLTGNAASITNPFSISTGGPFQVHEGDLIYAVIAEQTANTTTACTDNLGNTYTQTAAGTLSGTAVSGHAFYARITKAGSLSSVSFTTTASTNNVVAIAVCIDGPFQRVPIDKNPANITTDITTPYTCPTTGTLTQAKEVVMAWGCANYSTVWTATSPNLLSLDAATAAIAKLAIGHQTVAATTAVVPVFAAAGDPTAAVLGTTSFLGETAMPFHNEDDYWESPQAVYYPFTYPIARRGWISPAAVTPPAAAVIKPGAVTFTAPRSAVYPTTMLGWIQAPIQAAAVTTNVKPGAITFSLPRSAPRPFAIGWIGGSIGGPTTVSLPANQYDWPLPQVPWYRSNPGWIGGAIGGPITVSLPFNQSDWPLPQVPWYRRNVGWIGGSIGGPIDITLPFNQSDWPTPLSAAYPVSRRGWVQDAARAAAAIVGTPVQPLDWPLPRQANYPLNMRGWVGRVVGTGTPPAIGAPFSQYDWPLPQRPIYPTSMVGFIDFDSFSPQVVSGTPVVPIDWPLPQQKPYPAFMRGWIDFDSFSATVTPGVAAQASPITFSLPRTAYYPIDRRGWIDVGAGRTSPVLSFAQFARYEWPLPRQPSYPINMRGWVGRVVGTGTPAVTGTPVAQTDWPLPRTSPYPFNLRGFIDFDSFAPFVQPPTAPLDWPLPRAAYYPTPLRGWIQAAAQAAAQAVQAPTAQYDWPLPRSPYYPVSLRGLIATLNPGTVSFAQPFNQYDWRLPRAAYYPTSLYGQIGTLNPGTISYAQPFSQFSWPLPQTAYYPTSLRGQIGTLNPGTVSYVMGANQYDWALASWNHPRGVPDIQLQFPNLAIQFVPPVPNLTPSESLPFFATVGQLRTW